MARKGVRRFDPDGRCPICRKWFRSDECIHSIAEVEERISLDLLRQVVREELKRAGVTK